MAKIRFYAVVRGRKPGIYTQWTGENGAEAQVRGFPAAKFKGFPTREQAEYYLRTGGQETPEPPALLKINDSSPEEGSPKAAPAAAKPPSHETPSQTALPAGWDDYRAEIAAGKLVIFTDGASTGNPGPGGYGVVLLYGEARKELSGGFRCTTNNRMEMMGVITALESLNRRSQVVLYSDSRYVINAVEKGWARRWRSRGWMRDGENPAENADLWARLLDLLDQHQVEFRWVKGHASHPENERCDQLAVQAARQRNLPDDPGYRAKC